MKNEDFMGSKNEGHLRGGRHKWKDPHSHKHGAKTFRRGRVIAFLEILNVKRSTIKQQLDAPEFQSIHQILVGELKALDMVINEFSKLFEIHESEAIEITNKLAEETEPQRKETLETENKEND